MLERFHESLRSIKVLWVGENAQGSRHMGGQNFLKKRFSNIFDFRQEKIFDRGGGARYPLLCKFLAR